MRTKQTIGWYAASGLMALSLVLASCAPKAPTAVAPTTPATKPAEEQAPAKTAPKEVIPKETPPPPLEKPRYGGTAIISYQNDTSGFDQPLELTTQWPVVQTLVYEELLMGDRTMGPAGSGKSNFVQSGFATEGFFRETGQIAESWEIRDNQTLIFKIRQGIHWQNKPPMNGRELNADDVAFTINYVYLNPKAPESYQVISAPEGKKLLSARATDKWTVEVKVEDLAISFFEDVGDKMWIYPPESIKTYGNMKDWRNSLGTGPFMLTDYVKDSSATFRKNPDYWMKEVVGPGKGDKLPYLDGVKLLIIGDASTLYSAFRTAKVDWMSGGSAGASGPPSWFTWEQIQSVLKTNPETKYKQLPPISYQALAINSISKDPLAAPLMNKRVRQALNMAIDKETVLRDLYGGQGVKQAGPFFPDSPYYSTPDKMVEILEKKYGFKHEEAVMAKKMYEYHPDEAKKILAEEGYPNGFTTQTITEAINVDWISVVAGYWQKNLNVTLKIDIKDPGVHRSIANAKTFPAMIVQGHAYLTPGWPEKLNTHGPSDPTLAPKATNYVQLRNDAVLNNFMQSIYNIYGDYDARSRAFQELEPYLWVQGWWQFMPTPLSYRLWQPWLKGYYGEESYGYRSPFNFLAFTWYDRELKTKLGFK